MQYSDKETAKILKLNLIKVKKAMFELYKYKDPDICILAGRPHTNYNGLLTIKNLCDNQSKPLKQEGICKCGEELAYLSNGEYHCLRCDRYYLGKKEIFYSINGEICFK